nr:helix-turn-helix transcriptional regulator [Deinococcus betulae]
MTFGRRLREERQKRGMTLEDLAEASGITWSYIAQVEVGRRNISVDNMHFLATGVGLPLKDLL